MLYALISSGVPFSGEDRNETAYKILTNELSFSRSVWRTVSEDCKDLLRSMLNKDQSRRPSIKEVMQHRWFH
jgi:calcium-dependent protein kinase